MRILSVPETSRRLNVKSSTPRDHRWRARVGLPLIRIGRRVGFLESDVYDLIQRGRENLEVQVGAA